MWLTRNFGQHPATVAGIVSTNGDWVVTMDEDGQHDPRQIPSMLLTAAAECAAHLRQAHEPAAPRRATQRGVTDGQGALSVVIGCEEDFHCFRLMEGPIARSACAYIGENVYLDVAMRWSCGDAAVCPMKMRTERPLELQDAQAAEPLLADGPLHWNAPAAAHRRRRRRRGGHRTDRRGDRGGAASQRLVSGAGLDVGDGRPADPDGGLFISLAVVAEYVGFAVRNSIGKPLYVKAEHAGFASSLELAGRAQGGRPPF